MTVTVWILGDQLLAAHPALVAAEQALGREQVQVVLVESAGRIARLPYQRKKLVLLISAMRHYAEALRAQGYAVDYMQAPSAVTGLRRHLADHPAQHLYTMAAAECAGRTLQQARLAGLLGLPVTVLPNTQFLVGRFDPFPNPPRKVILETFYRAMRRRFGLLVDAHGDPVGGEWNFDKQNRKPLPKRGVAFPAVPSFAPDAITRQVMAEVAALPGALGTVAGFDLAVTRADALAALEDFVQRRLANFGPYEDAMTARSAVVFHSVLSPYLNLGLLEPLEVVQQAIAAFEAGLAPLNSVEGFVRQLIGWREYIYWQYWRQMPGLLEANAWGHTRPLPDFFWDGDTDLACLRTVIGRVLAHGYTHHIERLMVLCNFCVLAGIDPAQVNGWFLAGYIDAYEWVMSPNVIGMGLNADGGQTGTKPYIASANYIDKMSDYCAGCRYNPKQRTGPDACPFNALYWNFLITHEETLRANPRVGPAVLGLRSLDDAERAAVQAQARAFLTAVSGAA